MQEQMPQPTKIVKGDIKEMIEHAKIQIEARKIKEQEFRRMWGTLVTVGYDLPRAFSEAVNPYFALMRPYSDFLQQQTRTMAYFLAEMRGHHDALANDYWLAAEKYIGSVAVSAEVMSSASDMNFEEYFRKLQEAVPLQNYVERVSQLAQVMSTNAEPIYTDAVRFWIAAEKHILTIGARAIANAKSGSDAIEALRKAFGKFEAVNYLASIQESAYYVWKARGERPGHALDDWLKAEEGTLSV